MASSSRFPSGTPSGTRGPARRQYYRSSNITNFKSPRRNESRQWASNQNQNFNKTTHSSEKVLSSPGNQPRVQKHHSHRRRGPSNTSRPTQGSSPSRPRQGYSVPQLVFHDMHPQRFNQGGLAPSSLRIYSSHTDELQDTNHQQNRVQQPSSETWRTQTAWEHIHSLVPNSNPTPPKGRCRAQADKSCLRPLRQNRLGNIDLAKKLAHKNTRTKSLAAALLQVTGAAAPNPCSHCAKKCGPFEGCVVESSTAKYTGRRICANCVFSDTKGKRCNLRIPTSEPTPSLEVLQQQRTATATAAPGGGGRAREREEEEEEGREEKEEERRLASLEFLPLTPPPQRKQPKPKPSRKGKEKELSLFCTPTHREDSCLDASSRLLTPPSRARFSMSMLSSTSSARSESPDENNNQQDQHQQMFLEITETLDSKALKVKHRVRSIQRHTPRSSWPRLEKAIALFGRAIGQIKCEIDMGGCLDVTDPPCTAVLLPIEVNVVSATPVSDDQLLQGHLKSLRRLGPSQVREVERDLMRWDLGLRTSMCDE